MINNNGLGNSRASVGSYHKQSPIALKKFALRDVQNDKRNSISNQPENSCLLERGSKADTIKVSGAKRLIPDCPSSPPRRWSLNSSYANQDPMYADRKSDLDVSKRRVQETADRSAEFLQTRQYFSKQSGTPQRLSQKQEHTISYVPASAPNSMASLLSLSPCQPSVPISFKKSGNSLPASQFSHPGFTSEVSHSAELQGGGDQQRMERFVRLQKFLKQCDETEPKDYIQMLLYLSPTELSRHAIELEYRSIQLSIEEGKEIQRTMALNILGKSTQANNSLLPPQRVLPKK